MFRTSQRAGLTTTLLPLLALAFMTSLPAQAKSNKIKTGKDKTTVCHVTSSGRVIELRLPIQAAASHFGHGDYIGSDAGCDTGFPPTEETPLEEPPIEEMPVEEVPQSYRIMALGDSITEGVFGAQSYRKPLVDSLNNLACDYQMVGTREENLTPTDFISPHEGYSGHRVDFFVEGSVNAGNPGIDSIMADHMPDIILVHLGSNDMRLAQPVNAPYLANGLGGTIEELDALVTKIWNANAEAEVYIANVIPWYGTSSANANVTGDIQSLSTAIGTWVVNENDTRLHLVDVNSEYQSSYMQSDLIHPNASGDLFIANTFLTELNANGVCVAN